MPSKRSAAASKPNRAKKKSKANTPSSDEDEVKQQKLHELNEAATKALRGK